MLGFQETKVGLELFFEGNLSANNTENNHACFKILILAKINAKINLLWGKLTI